jgi:hypothetical protein
MCGSPGVSKGRRLVLTYVRFGHTQLAHVIFCVVNWRLLACNVMYLLTLTYLADMSISEKYNIHLHCIQGILRFVSRFSVPTVYQ